MSRMSSGVLRMMGMTVVLLGLSASVTGFVAPHNNNLAPLASTSSSSSALKFSPDELITWFTDTPPEVTEAIQNSRSSFYFWFFGMYHY
jgi:hypothetical protein